MTVANMIIVEVKPVNEVKTADRLLQNEMVIINGGVLATVKEANFYEGNDKVTLTFETIVKETKEPGTTEMTVERKALFNVVSMLTK